MAAHKNKDSLMYSLSINFGPAGTVWAFLFKEKDRAEHITADIMNHTGATRITDDFGQSAFFEKNSISGFVLEDLDTVEEARIQRSLINARGEVKARQRAATDPVIRQAQNAGPSVMTPNFRQ
jgi:hypothetical protein